MGFQKNDGLLTEFFGVWLASPPKNETLLKVNRLVDWEVMRIMMKPLYKDNSRARCPGYTPVSLLQNHWSFMIRDSCLIFSEVPT